MLRKLIGGAVVATSLLAATVAYAETAFTPEAESLWVARSLRMADLLGTGDDFESIKHSLGASCDGLTSEQAGHEYGRAPKWAITSQISICAAYGGWAGKFGGSKVMCKNLEDGIAALAGADTGAYSAAVVNAAHSLVSADTKLLAAARSERHACTR